jgi:hypothetical protein
VLFLVIEHFRGGDPRPVYTRFQEQGRLAPAGLEYLGSWVTVDLAHCYQVMACEDRQLLDEWMAQWADLVEFNVIPVVSSAEAAARAGQAAEHRSA